MIDNSTEVDKCNLYVEIKYMDGEKWKETLNISHKNSWNQTIWVTVTYGPIIYMECLNVIRVEYQGT